MQPPMPPGVTVTVQNIVVQPQPVMPVPYGQPMHLAQPMQPMQPAIDRGVVGMMKDDASQRAMEAVARRGPARVLAYGVGLGTAALGAVLLTMIALGASWGVLLLAVPLFVASVVSFVIGARAGQGVASHHLEQAILRVASEHQGVVRVVAIAQATGRPLRECQTAIDAMVSSGHATVEADEHGALIYRVPDLEPHRPLLVQNTEIMGAPPNMGEGR
jgi:hypothetical protein